MDGQFRVPKQDLSEECDEGKSPSSSTAEIHGKKSEGESTDVSKMEVDEYESEGRPKNSPKKKTHEESEGGYGSSPEKKSRRSESERRFVDFPTTDNCEESEKRFGSIPEVNCDNESERRSRRNPKIEIDDDGSAGRSGNIPTARTHEVESRSTRVPKTEINDELEEGEIERPPPRESTPPPPRRFRSREPSLEPQVPIYKNEVYEMKKHFSDIFSHSVFYKGQLIENDFPGDFETSNVSEIGKICCSAIQKGRNFIFSANDPETKTEISRFALEKCAAEKKYTYFVVRNDVIARRRYFELSADFPHVSLLSLRKGKVDSKHGLVFVVTIDVIRILLYHGVNFGNNILIFDDCEYLGDPGIGSMYEEALTMLGYAQLILFFPQISNADQIARWICNNFNNDVESVAIRRTEFPIRHFVCYYQKGNAVSMSLVLNEKGEFNETALEVPPDRSSTKSINMKKNDVSIYEIQDSIVRLIRTANGLSQIPVLVYCHKTDDVERLANNMGNFNFNPGTSKFGALEEDDSRSESKKVIEHFEIFTSMLEEPERKNPQIEMLKQFAIRGIGIYHSGMIPFFRDITEELFLHGLIRVLFSDKSVIWDTNLKFKSVIIYEPRVMVEPGFSRWMTSREFHSIVERVAGKFGDNPFVVTVPTIKIPLDVARTFYTKESPPINSELRFSPNSILNLSRSQRSNLVHEAKIDKNFLLQKSFIKFQRIEEAERISDDLRNKKSLLRSLDIKERIKKDLESYNSLSKEIESKKEEIYSEVVKHEKIKDFFQLGRVLKIHYNGHDFGYGVVLQKGSTKLSVAVRATKESFEAEDPKCLRPVVEGEPETLAVISIVPAKNVTRISSFRLRLPLDKKLEDAGVKEFIIWCLKEEEKQLGFPDLDPIEDLKINDEGISTMWKRLKKLCEKIKTIEKETDDFDMKWKTFKEKLQLESEIRNLEDIKAGPNLEDLNEQFQNIKEFLNPVRFFNEDGQTLSKKGIFASYLRNPNPIMVTDLLFNTKFFEKSPKDVILALSYMIESEVQDEFLQEPEISILKPCKIAVEKYATFWQEVTKESGNKMEKKFHYTLMVLVKSLLSDRFRGFHEIYRYLRFTIREGFLALYLKKLDELLLEIHNLKGFLPSEYTDEFWEELEKLRVMKIHRGLATATIGDLRIHKIDSFK